MWAYAASGVLDYLLSLECVDRTRVTAAGHSRLGKTPLWAAANDTRFTHAFSNESGCAGTALTRKIVRMLYNIQLFGPLNKRKLRRVVC